MVGLEEGAADGESDGPVVGPKDGVVLGLPVGEVLNEGALVPSRVGLEDGLAECKADGLEDGVPDGALLSLGINVGAIVWTTGVVELKQFSAREVHLPSATMLPSGKFSQQPTQVQALSPIVAYPAPIQA